MSLQAVFPLRCDSALPEGQTHHRSGPQGHQHRPVHSRLAPAHHLPRLHAAAAVGPSWQALCCLAELTRFLSWGLGAQPYTFWIKVHACSPVGKPGGDLFPAEGFSVSIAPLTGGTWGENWKIMCDRTNCVIHLTKSSALLSNQVDNSDLPPCGCHCLLCQLLDGFGCPESSKGETPSLPDRQAGSHWADT